MIINPTEKAVNSLIRLHSPQDCEIKFAIAILDIALIALTEIDPNPDYVRRHFNLLSDFLIKSLDEKNNE